MAKLRQAASAEDVYALIRYGGAPGIMYVRGRKSNVDSWVAAVQRLRYKDFQLAIRPVEVQTESDESHVPAPPERLTGLCEVESVKEFASQMHAYGVLDWWRTGMGYAGDQGRL